MALHGCSVARFIALALFSCLVFGQSAVPDVNGYCYVQEGHLNIAMMAPLSTPGAPGVDEACTNRLRVPTRVQPPEATKFAVNEINARDDILVNITLGFVIMDTCYRDTVALSRALNCIPQKSGPDDKRRLLNISSEPRSYECRDDPTVEVVGVLGPSFSRSSVMVASLLSLFEIPVLSTFSTSDELSDKSRFRYFMRLVPPDSLQAQAIIDLCVHYEWTYISLLYTEGSYGENGEKQITTEANKAGICLAYTKKLPSDASQVFVETVVEHLIENYKARAVVVFTNSIQGTQIYQAAMKLNVHNYFIWIGADGLSDIEDFSVIPHNAMLIRFPARFYQPFTDYFRYLTPLNASDNIWVHRLWKDYYGCDWSWQSEHCEEVFRNITAKPPNMVPFNSKYYDGIYVYAYALDRLIKKQCPEAFTNQEILKDCFDGATLYSYMLNVTFPGVSGNVKFDEKGNMMAEYDFVQHQVDNTTGPKYVEVGVWSKNTESLSVFSNVERFKLQKIPESIHIINEMPKSVCSEPCLPRQFRIQKELPCCWECFYCRENERIRNGSECERCEDNTWPDEETATECEPIDPSYMHTRDPLALTLIIVNCCVLAFLILAVAFFRVNKNNKLIKASSAELTNITTSGIACALLTVFTFTAKPTAVSCKLSHFGFHLSVTLIYAPLLLKTVRVYRIFAGGKKGTRNLRLINKASQLTMSLLTFLIQVINSSSLFLYHSAQNRWQTQLLLKFPMSLC